MKVLWAARLPPHPGGSGISLGEIICEVARAGIQCRVIAPVTDETRAAAQRFAESHPELEIDRYRMPEYDIAPYDSDRAELLRSETVGLASLFQASVADFRPTLVVAGHESASATVVGLSRSHGLPCIQLVRGSPTGEVLRGVYPEPEAVQLLRAFTEADQVITVSKFQELGLKKLGLHRVVTIPNAIDTERFRPRPASQKLREDLGVDQGRTVVLAPANLHPRKRPLDVVFSAARAVAANPSLLYIMAGRGSLLGDVQERCRSLNLGNNFRFPGWVDYARMPALMNLADLVVMPSESEGMSRACLEAMACERALLASDIPAARELIKDGQNGRLFRMGDTEHLAALTLELAADVDGRRRLGRRARSRLRGHSLSDVRRRYVEILHRVSGEETARGTPGSSCCERRTEVVQEEKGV